LTTSCSSVVPGQPLSKLHQLGLNLVAQIDGGRDVVLAIDLTESVGLNDEGQLRLQQIVEDSLRPGDLVYIVPFATSINPQDPTTNPLTPSRAIVFHGRREEIEQILQAVPKTDSAQKNTDIELAELSIYQNLAKLNQCRLPNESIKSQSVVWITDAPLLTKTGAEWTETPTESPFRVATSPESQLRQSWLNTLPRHARQLPIKTEKNQDYNLTVVDIAPTVQEFCTPVPGGRETCLVTPYLIRQLWLPTTGLALVLILLLLGLRSGMRLKKKWQLTVEFDMEGYERKIIYLPHKGQIAIGGSGLDAIDCPGDDVRAYLKRQGSRLYLIPVPSLQPVLWNGNEITEKKLITNSRIRLNCQNDRKRDFEITVRVKKT